VFDGGLCYVIYNGVDWPGNQHSGHDLFPDRASTVGSSRQKQVLRISGPWWVASLLGWAHKYSSALSGFDCGIHHFFCRCHRLRFLVHDFQPTLSYFGVQIGRCFFASSISIHSQSSLRLSIARSVVGILFGLIHDVASSRSTMGASAVST